MAGVVVAWSSERLPAAIRPVTRMALPLAGLAAGLAVLPDLDLLFVRMHRTYSHSVTAVALVIIVAAAVTRWVTGRVQWSMALLCGAIYGSHLALDWLGEDRYTPRGLQVFWPLSDQFFISDWDLFRSTERSRPLSAPTMRHNFRTAIQEIATLGPFLLALWLTRDRARPKAGAVSHAGQQETLR